MRKSHSSNDELQTVIALLRKTAATEDVKIWKRVANDLSKSSRQRRVVNLSRINNYSKDNDTIIVPGKVLSSGDIDHKVQVVAFNFSKSAIDKIVGAKGTAMTITELLKANPRPKGIKIIG
jgi:large subunit ribosomal protein L18e